MVSQRRKGTSVGGRAGGRVGADRVDRVDRGGWMAKNGGGGRSVLVGMGARVMVGGESEGGGGLWWWGWVGFWDGGWGRWV